MILHLLPHWGVVSSHLYGTLMYENYDDPAEFHIDHDDYEDSPSGGYKLVYRVMLGTGVAQ